MKNPVAKEKPQIRTEFDVYKNKYTFVQSEISEDGKNLVEIYQGPNNEILRSKAFLADPDRWVRQEETIVEEDGTVLSLERFEPKCGFPCYKMENAKDGTIRTTITRYPTGMSPTVPWLEKDRHVTVYEQSPKGEITTTMTQYHDQHNYDQTVITPDKTETTVIMRSGDKISETIKTKNKTVTTEYERGYTDDGSSIIGADPSRKASETIESDDWTVTKRWEKGVLKSKKTEDHFHSSLKRGVREEFYEGEGMVRKTYRQPYSFYEEECDGHGNIMSSCKRTWDDHHQQTTVKRAYSSDGCIETIEEELLGGSRKRTENKYIKDKSVPTPADDPGRLVYSKEEPDFSNVSETWYFTTGKPGRVEKTHSSVWNGKTRVESTRVFSPDGKLSWERTVSEKGLIQTHYDEKGNVRFTITQNPEQNITLRYNHEGKLETLVLKDEKGKGHVSQGIMAKLKARARKKPSTLSSRRHEYEG